MTTKAFLGLDLGTGSLKAIVVDGDGRTIAIASAGYPLESRHPDWSETDAGKWWDAAVSATRQALEAAGRPTISAIGFSAQMHGHVLVDTACEPLRPAILWSDGRAESSRRYRHCRPAGTPMRSTSTPAVRSSAMLKIRADS